MSSFPQLTPWRGPTAPPPPMRPLDWGTTTLYREGAINALSLLELTGIPSLYRWGRAIWTGRPYPEVEKEYFEPFYKQLQDVGAAAPSPPKLEVQLPPAPPIPPDYIFDKKRESPTIINIPKQVSDILAPPEDLNKRLREMGVPTSPEDLAAQVAGRSMVLSLAAVPGFAGMSKEALRRLAAEAAVGFGVAGTGAAATRTVQGYPEEALPAFIEVGLASTVLGDVINAFRGLARLPQSRIDNVIKTVRGRAQSGVSAANTVKDEFMTEVEETLLRLKKGDTSKYDQLLRQFEDWQKKIEEFNKLYEARQKGSLPPEDEARYTKLLKEVLEIRDKYETLKMYVDAARETGLEAWGRRMELESRTITDLANAAQAAPPGPPPRDVTEWLQRLDYNLLLKLAKDPQKLAKYARRFGVDEQTLAERAALMLRERQWEKLAELHPDELRRILTDRDALKKYASEFGMSEDDLMTKVEEILQQRKGAAPPTEQPKPPSESPKPPEAQPTPPSIELPNSDVRPPIKRTPKKETQFRPPETEGMVTTRGGQVLIVRAKEEPKPTVTRLDDLPDVQTRLRTLLRRRLKEEESPETGRNIRDTETSGDRTTLDRSVSTNDRSTDIQTDKNKQTDRQTTDSTATTNKTTDTSNTTTTSTDTTTATSDRVVVDRETLRIIVPALPASVFAMPALTVLAMISQAIGAPITLAPGIPRPAPRESFGNWLDRVYAGSGFSWRSLAAQRETFVFA